MHVTLRWRGRRRVAGAAVAATLATLASTGLTAAPATAATTFALSYSAVAQRTSPAALEGATLTSASLYAFVTPTDGVGVKQVNFWLDNPTRIGAPRLVEKGAPHDFAGTDTASGNAKPFDLRSVAAGQHSITAEVVPTTGASTVLVSNFTVGASTTGAALTATPSSVALTVAQGSPAVTRAVSLSGAAATFGASSSAPWLAVTPLTGSAPASLTLTISPSSLPVGTTQGSVTVTSPNRADRVVPVTVTVTAAGGGGSTGAASVAYSLNTKRTSPISLAGASVSGKIYPFLANDAGVTSVSWYLDDPSMTGQPIRVDAAAPFDFAPGSVSYAAAALDTATIADGQHTITAKLSGSAPGTVSATFTSTNNTNQLTFNPSSLSITAAAGGAAVTRSVALSAQKSGTTATLTSDAPWLRAAASAAAPANVTVTIDPNGLGAGQYTATLRATASGGFDGVLQVTLIVGDTGGCTPIGCDLIKVATPYNLDWRYDSGGILDRKGSGTGFTTLLKKGTGDGYIRDLLSMNLSNGTLNLTSTPGAGYLAENAQDNMVGVGFDGGTASTISTTLPGLPAGLTGKYEQAGLWFGYDQDHFDRMMLVSSPTGLRFEHVLEVAGKQVSRKVSSITAIASDQTVGLSLRTDPVKHLVTAYYKIGDGGETPLGAFTAPPEFFSADAAGIDPRIDTRSFAGIMASQRTATVAPTFSFSSFSITGMRDAGASADFPFVRKSYTSPGLSLPTSMVVGKDGRLYVLTVYGKLHALTLDAQHNVTADQTITALGSRLALGLTEDPAATATNEILWVAHSSPAQVPDPDSGIVSTLSGPNLSVRTDVITGLPRSIANHSTNNLHFAANGLLYIAQGGNTGAGAPNTDNTEFGDRAEEPLSGALLTADVKAPGFNGSCADPSDYQKSGLNCDVHTFATGLRNTYDFTIASNGLIYGPNNGLGVVGSFPSKTTAPCYGFGSTAPWTSPGGGNPGLQNDDLNLIEQGKYYGSPNPTRNECVFKDGHYQQTAPLPNYTPPLLDLGPNRSADGIIQYHGNAFCGSLDKSLVITNYSVGDNLTAVKLSDDGRHVISSQSIIGGFKDPLPITELPDGTIVVGEFGGDAVTFLEPQNTGCWSTEAPLPVKTLDANGTAIGNTLYVVGGKTAQGHTAKLWAYDSVAGTWTAKADMPAAVENPAVTTSGGKLYVFGGALDAFTGSTSGSYAYNPATNAWTTLASLPTPRGGATAQVINGKAYVIGGMLNDGSSTAKVEVYDLAGNTWANGVNLSTARDNPGSSVIAGTLYVFGGRTRMANGDTPQPTLNTTEAWTPGASAWVAKANMPTGRRTMAVATVGGTFVAMGGEIRPDGGAFDNAEQYIAATDTWVVLPNMPTGRHGAVAGAIGNKVHVVGGGPTGGLAFTDVHEVLTLSAAS